MSQQHRVVPGAPNAVTAQSAGCAGRWRPSQVVLNIFLHTPPPGERPVLGGVMPVRRPGAEVAG